MLLCRHARWGLRRRGVTAKEGAEHERGGVSRLTSLRTKVAHRLGITALVTPNETSSSVQVPDAKMRRLIVHGSGRRSSEKLTKFVGGPVMIRTGGSWDRCDGPGWSTGLWSL